MRTHVFQLVRPHLGASPGNRCVCVTRCSAWRIYIHVCKNHFVPRPQVSWILDTNQGLRMCAGSLGKTWTLCWVAWKLRGTRPRCSSLSWTSLSQFFTRGLNKRSNSFMDSSVWYGTSCVNLGMSVTLCKMGGRSRGLGCTLLLFGRA